MKYYKYMLYATLYLKTRDDDKCTFSFCHMDGIHDIGDPHVES